MINRSHQNSASLEHVFRVARPEPVGCAPAPHTTSLWKGFLLVKTLMLQQQKDRKLPSHFRLQAEPALSQAPGSCLLPSCPRGSLQIHTEGRWDHTLPLQPSAQHEAIIICLGSAPRPGLQNKVVLRKSTSPKRAHRSTGFFPGFGFLQVPWISASPKKSVIYDRGSHLCFIRKWSIPKAQVGRG